MHQSDFDDFEYINNNNLIFQKYDSFGERTILGYDDLSDLPNPDEPTDQHQPMMNPIINNKQLPTMNSHNDNQKEVLRLIDSLASINNKEYKAEQAKKIVEDKWDQFHSDFENTSCKKRYSTGKVEKGLFKHVADVCNWKTNKKYMRIASQIMILCGYHSYEKENRFKQKIQNNLKKNLPRPHKDRPDSIQVTNDVPFPFDQEDFPSRDELYPIIDDFSNLPYPVEPTYQHQQMMNPIINNEQQPTMNQYEMYEQQLIHHNNLTNKDCIPSGEDSVDYSINSLSDFNIDNPLLRQSVDTDYGNNNYYIFQEDYSS